ncbi:MAG: hypothetical protein WEE67_05110 [Chloroflexota bacterium]
MTNRPDHLSDDVITQFLRTRSADPDLGLLDDIVRTVGATPQDRPWLGVRQILFPRRALLMVAIALLLATMGAIGVGSLLLRPDLPVVPLPTTPDAWERVLIETPSGTGNIVASLAASPHGLLAVVTTTGTPGDGPTRLVVSTDGRNWTLVPEGQHPTLSETDSFGLPSVVGTDRGFLLLQLNEVWMSEDGYNWQRLASSAEDPDLLEGRMLAAVAAGPGLVAVGSDNKAWYSTDGSDWSVAEVPPPPAEIFEREGYPAPSVDMQGVAVAGDKLVAWGGAEATNAADWTMVAPVLWASSNGLSWTNVLDSQIGSLFAVAGGPGGFVALAETQGSATAAPRDGVWFSPDGQAWERVDVFDSRWSEVDFNLVNDEGMLVKLMMRSAAATSAGYVAVGGDGLCLLGSCLSAEALIWTSSDGRSWSRLPSDDLFKVTEPRDPAYTSGAWAMEVVAWGSRFVVGGVYDGRPAIWISDSARTPGGGEPSPAAADGSPGPVSTEESNGPAPSDGRAVAFAGAWQTTDGDGSHPTMEVITLSNGTYAVTIRDDLASVCDGAPSTMTGVAEAGEPGTFVIGQPEFVCDDGSQPQALSGPPLEEQLKDLGFVYDFRGDSLRDSLGGLVWTRLELAP